GDFKKLERSAYISIDEGLWIFYRPVHMSLGSEVYETVWAAFFEHRFDRISIGDVAIEESETRISMEVFDATKISSVCELVDHNNAIVRVIKCIPNKVCAYESGTAGDYDRSHSRSHVLLSVIPCTSPLRLCGESANGIAADAFDRRDCST